MSKFKNKAERNAGHRTLAQEIFGGKKIINERPEGMSRDEYRMIRKMQTEILKQLFHKGHCPSRKLSGIMGVKQPSVRITAPTRKINTPRKAS